MRWFTFRFFLAQTLLAISIVLVVYVSFIARFSHPELTETQLFLKYWPQIVIGLASGILGFKVWI